MKRLMVMTLAAGGLLLLDAPQAAAHQEVRNVHNAAPYYRVDERRMGAMPRWLKRNKPFVRWYRHAGFRHDHWISWNELFRVYTWQRAGIKRYYPGIRHYRQPPRHRLQIDVHRATQPHRHVRRY